jgi:DNA-binding NtrC family response regulator
MTDAYVDLQKAVNLYMRAYLEKNKIKKGDQLLKRVYHAIDLMIIKEALNMTDGNKTAVSDLLGISRITLNNKIKSLNIDAKQFKKK